MVAGTEVRAGGVVFRGQSKAFVFPDGEETSGAVTLLLCTSLPMTLWEERLLLRRVFVSRKSQDA